VFELVGGNGFAEEIALIGFTALHTKKGRLISGLDSLRANMQLEGTAHPGDGAYDWGIDLAELQIFDETLD
jgi:hypothetical protein